MMIIVHYANLFNLEGEKVELEGKIIVLTGATSGIGKEIFKKLAIKNKLIVISRHGEDLKCQSNSNIWGFNCDFSKPFEVEQVADQVIKQFPQIDILINNAAIQYTPQFLDSDFAIETVERETMINFVSVCRLIHFLMPSMLKQSRSIILNVNSGLGLIPKTTSAVYCATKAALNSFSISLSYQLEETNIRVLQAFMPLVDTPMTHGRGKGKITAEFAAEALIEGIKKEKKSNDIGKVKILRFLLNFAPFIAVRIMKRT